MLDTRLRTRAQTLRAASDVRPPDYHAFVSCLIRAWARSSPSTLKTKPSLSLRSAARITTSFTDTLVGR